MTSHATIYTFWKPDIYFENENEVEPSPAQIRDVGSMLSEVCSTTADILEKVASAGWNYAYVGAGNFEIWHDEVKTQEEVIEALGKLGIDTSVLDFFDFDDEEEFDDDDYADEEQGDGEEQVEV